MQVPSKAVEEGRVENGGDIKGLCEKLVDSKIKVCPGISMDEYEGY